MAFMPTLRRYPIGNGTQVVAEVAGDPACPSVLLLHGGGQTRHAWSRAARVLLDDGYHVINLDARGHGDSDWAPDGDYSRRALADDLCRVVATLPSPPAIVGASMGGTALLQAVGGEHRCPATALVLVDLVPRVDPQGVDRIVQFMLSGRDGFASVEEAADAVAAYNPLRARPRDPAGLMKNLRRQPDGRLRWHWDPRFVEGRSRLDPREMAEPLLEAARNIRLPTLLVRGMMSDVVTGEGADELRRNMPSLEVLDVAGAGHMVAGDRNDAFNDGVLHFLRRHHPSGRSRPD